MSVRVRCILPELFSSLHLSVHLLRKVKSHGNQSVDRLDRVEKTSEFIYLAPFKSNIEPYEYVNITAEVISCPLGPFDGGCELGETCATRYPSTWYPGNRGKFIKLSRNKRTTVAYFRNCRW